MASDGVRRKTDAASVLPDLTLYQQLQAILPKQRPRLPYLCGEVQGFHVLLVDGNQVKLRERKDQKTSHIGEGDFMDFVEGGNGYEDTELCGKDEIYIDGLLDPSCWPFVGLHEIYEATKMRQGWTYDRAHEAANQQEKHFRLNQPSPPT